MGIDDVLKEGQRHLQQEEARRAEAKAKTAAKQRRCPECTFPSDEAFDYDLAGNDVHHCDSCGIIFSYPEGHTEALIIDNGGF